MATDQGAPAPSGNGNPHGNDSSSDNSGSTLTVPDNMRESFDSNHHGRRPASAALPPNGSMSFTIKSVAATATTEERRTASLSCASSASTLCAESRSRSSNNIKSRHIVRFAGAAGSGAVAGESLQQGEDPVPGRSQKNKSSPPPPPATTAFTPDPTAAAAAAAAAAAINPGNKFGFVAVSAGDGLSGIGRRSFESEPAPGAGPAPGAVAHLNNGHDTTASAPPSASSLGGRATAARTGVRRGRGPRQRALAEAQAVLARDGGSGDSGGGSSGGSGSGGGDGSGGGSSSNSGGSSSGGGGSNSGGGSSSGGEGATPPATGTFMHQSRLPKLQVPPLGDTLGRYLRAVAPLLSPEAFAVTKGVVQEFETSGEGEVLQRSLLEYAADKDSFVEEFWDDSYLTPKSSVVLNLNPFFVFETPTLSTHSKDLGDEIGDAGACSSCGAGDGSEDRSRFPSPRRRSANGGIDDYDGNSSRSSFYRSPPHKRGDRRGSEPASRRAARDTSRAAVAGKKQARRAASLLYSSLRFASAVRSETLPPDLWRDTPLCMAQYRRLFGAHRKAVENDPDEMRVCEDSRHVVVLCKNQFYCFSALHPDGRVGITEEELEEIVLAVQEDAAKANLAKTAVNAVGVLTTQTRDDWAVARRRLAAADETNKRYLHLVDTALFVLCLDHTSPCTAAEIAASCLHGSYALEGDVQVGTCTNRWYDKLQLIVFENGAAGVNFEHTWVDGHTVLRFASDVFADVIYRFANHLTSTTGGARGREGMGEVFPPDKQAFSLCEGRSPVKMEWRLPKDMRRDIYFAETRISDLIRQHDVQALEYDTFGKRFITQNKMSPDAFVQMSIVYGYYGLYGDVVAAYEPVLTKSFLKGRTEALRTVTAEVKAFLEAFSNPDTSTKRKMLSLRTAIVSHGRLVKLAAKGKGVDRHLFALLCMAKKKAEEARAAAAAAEAKEAVPNGGDSNGIPPPSPPSQIPALFEDEAWRVLNHVILSTSNCGNPSLRLFGFGPVVRDGFGVGYIIKENQLKLVVTSKNRQTDRFVGKIREFFDTVFHTYSPSQIHGRVRVVAAEGASDESGGYSMWGSFRNKKGDALL